MDIQIPEKTKRRAFMFSCIKKAQNFFGETDERVYAIANVKLTIQSMWIL